MVLFSLLFSFSLFSMDAPGLLIPKEIIHYSVMQSDLQTIGRFGQTCHVNNQWYHDYMICKDPHNNDCQSRMCRILTGSFNKCTRSLVFYAKEYIKDSSNERAFCMFKHLWQHDASMRDEAVEIVAELRQYLENGVPAWRDCIDIYAGNYAAKEMKIISCNTSLAKKMERTIYKANSYRLKKFLIEENVVAVATMLLADNLLFYPQWSGHKYNRDRDKYNFGNKKRDTLLDCACLLGDVGIIEQLVSKQDCFCDVIQSMISYYKVKLLDTFIRRNFKKAKDRRFTIWYAALKERKDWNNAPGFDQQLQLNTFETIMTLLFCDDINARDPCFQTLLHQTIREENEFGVKFLLEHGADTNIKDGNRLIPLWHAYKDPAIASLLIEYHADVNQNNADEKKMILMAPAFYMRWNENTKKVFELLIKAGADVNAVTADNQSVLHRYAGLRNYLIMMSSTNIAEIISILIRHGAKIDVKDNRGRTPFDYAQDVGNEEATNILRIYDEEGVGPSATDSWKE